MNYTEARVIALQLRAKAIEIEVVSMHVNDLRAITQETGEGTYVEEEYLKRSNDIKKIADEIDLLRVHL